MEFSKAEREKYTHACADHYRDEDINIGKKYRTLKKGVMPIFGIPRRVKCTLKNSYLYF